MKADSFLVDLLTDQVVPASQARFPDGAHFRTEIPSVEGPAILEVVLETADQYGVVINRVSQGSGAMLHSQAELRAMAEISAERGLEVSLFVGPRNAWSIGGATHAADGPVFGSQLRGMRQLRYGVEDVLRAVECGIRGFLIADLGLLDTLVNMQSTGDLPSDICWKISVMMAPTNPASFRHLVRSGAGTINVPADLSLEELAELRHASNVPIDLYIEAPDSLGGVVRGNEIADIVAVSSPVYVKFGLRNSRSLYPSGLHLQSEAEMIAREKVRRAAVALEWLERLGGDIRQSSPFAEGLAIAKP
ncbi:MAG: hypothetical protein FJW97_02435 [Actinobacteria bacterium]|nr:hypothetical protein [Actinomycetota bacterium]